MSEKAQILEAVKEVIAPEPKMGIGFLAGVLLSLAIALLLLFPKVFLQNQIYYKSRDIAQLEHEHDALKEENRLISSEVESMRFKNQILDTLFLID